MKNIIQKLGSLPITLITSKNFFVDDRFDIPNFASLIITCTDFYIMYLEGLDPSVQKILHFIIAKNCLEMQYTAHKQTF